MEIIKRLEDHRHSQSHQKHVRYPAELKRAAGAYYQKEIAGGRRRHDIAHELGMHANTLDCWRPSRGGKAKGATAAFRAVIVLADKRASSGTMVVHGPGCLRSEGLGIAQLVEIVRALA